MVTFSVYIVKLTVNQELVFDRIASSSQVNLLKWELRFLFWLSLYLMNLKGHCVTRRILQTHLFYAGTCQEDDSTV